MFGRVAHDVTRREDDPLLAAFVVRLHDELNLRVVRIDARARPRRVDRRYHGVPKCLRLQGEGTARGTDAEIEPAGLLSQDRLDGGLDLVAQIGRWVAAAVVGRGSRAAVQAAAGVANERRFDGAVSDRSIRGRPAAAIAAGRRTRGASGAREASETRVNDGDPSLTRACVRRVSAARCFTGTACRIPKPRYEHDDASQTSHHGQVYVFAAPTLAWPLRNGHPAPPRREIPGLLPGSWDWAALLESPLQNAAVSGQPMHLGSVRDQGEWAVGVRI